MLLKVRTPFRHVALAYPGSESHFHLITQGIAEYGNQHGYWSFTTAGETATLSLASLQGWQGDGIIASVSNAAEAEASLRFHQAGIPIVTFMDVVPAMGVPHVSLDDISVGTVAADHLVGCGFRCFGFYGLRNVNYSDARLAGFRRRLQQIAGYHCETYCSESVYEVSTGVNEIDALAAWLRRLQLPVGILAANDVRARMVLDACRLANLKVPREVGIVGVDNSPLVCNSCQPTLSSVDCDWHQLGTELAKRLDRLISRRPLSSVEGPIDPKGIVTRESTAVQLFSDERVSRVIAFVHDHLDEDFSVSALALVARTSRRRLEQVFAQAVGCTLYRYVCKVRVDRAKDMLLRNAQMKISEVSARCGFTDVRRMHEVFYRFEGESPTAFRESRKVR